MLVALDLCENAQKNLFSWYPNFDISIIKHYYYIDNWNNYDCSGFLMVFLGIDDTYQILQDEKSPFSSYNENLMSYEVTEIIAIEFIKDFKETVKSVEESDEVYGVY